MVPPTYLVWKWSKFCHYTSHSKTLLMFLIDSMSSSSFIYKKKHFKKQPTFEILPYNLPITLKISLFCKRNHFLQQGHIYSNVILYGNSLMNSLMPYSISFHSNDDPADM